MNRIEERFPRPDWVRRINAMGESVGGAQHMIPLDIDGMVASAIDTTGLEDFGEFIDGDWRGRLSTLVEALEGQSEMSVVGRLMVRQEIIRCLRSRLFLARRIKDNPAILDEVIREPVIITGTGRSGTSITLELLSQDPDCLAPIPWKTMHPAAHTDDPATLLRITECEEDFWTDVVPQMAAIHELRADLPEECIMLQKPSFTGMFWWVLHNLPEWPVDLEAAMKYHKAVLQTVQYGKPDAHWVLKTPTYLPMIDLLFDVYPDAWVVLNHRDPMKTTPSGISTLIATRWLRSDADNMDELVAMSSLGSGDLMIDIDRRRRNGELPDRIIDLHFSDLMQNPVAAIEQLYQSMGKQLSAEHARRISSYLEHKPKGKFGKHSYSPEDWGVESDALRTQSEAYMACFNVTEER